MRSIPPLRALLFLIVGIGFLFSASSSATAGDAKKYGDGVELEESMKISALLMFPDGYVGKTVRVEGRIVGVCAKRGCWMELAGDREFESMRIKVDDGVIVFPADAKGQYAIAEGEFMKIELSLEQTRSYYAHQAQEQGTEFDPESVTEVMVIYQIKGTGATIEDRPAKSKDDASPELETKQS